jgi:hypothetical protein
MRNQPRWVQYGFLAFVVLVTAAFLFLDPILRSRTKRDVAGAPEQEGTAVVAILLIPDKEHTEGPADTKVSVRFRGGIYPVKMAYRPQELHVDQPAHITFRVGKSGAIVVDSVEPVAPSTAPPHN